MKKFIMSVIAANLLALPAFAATCFKLDEKKSDQVPSYIWIVKEVCVDNFMIVSGSNEMQVKMKGLYEIRTNPQGYPRENILKDFDDVATYPAPYKGYYRLLYLNFDNSASIHHYWNSRTMVSVNGDLSNPQLKIYAEILEFRHSYGQAYKLVYAVTESAP